MSIVQPTADQPIVEPGGSMSSPMRLWVQQVNGLQVLTGAGSPEGVVSAPITTLYMNTAGGAGSVLYIKRDAAVSADPKDGWILV